MPPKKPTQKRTTKKAEVIAAESNDTQLLIVILLLVLVYPLGILFMWYWMKMWPTWLKIIISLPFIIGIVAAMTACFVGIALMHRFAMNKDFRNRWETQVQIQRQKDATTGATFYLSPTVAPSHTATPTSY